jgi:Nif-specific regulatory protein
MSGALDSGTGSEDPTSAVTVAPPLPAVRPQVSELALLFEISRLLDSSLDLGEVVHPVLEAIDAHLGIRLGVLSLLNRATESISIEAAFGLSASAQRRGHYRIGEGIIGRVIETGEPIVVARVADEPALVNRTGALDAPEVAGLSLICVPIKAGSVVFGCLLTDRVFDEPTPVAEDVRLLSILASLISQAVKLRQAAQEDSRRLLAENDRLREELAERFRPENLVGNSEAMLGVFSLIGQVSHSDATVLIRGETGTGKDLVAHAIHYNSARSGGAFIKVNCAALPESIIESELFGHERGAFTGAIAARKGRFELADGGSIFLDEIGDLTPTTQVKLLRVLQEREFERVGGTATLRCDVRVIAATNRNLEELIAEGGFRSDLYYRLNVFPIHIPPLRVRKSDVLLLADYFVEKYARQNRKSIKRITTAAIDMLMSYHWPGNVRELENCIERAALVSSDVIHGHHLPPTLQTADASGTAPQGSLHAELERVERELVQDALKWAKGNMARAARSLGVSERIMGLRITKYRIRPRNFRR